MTFDMLFLSEFVFAPTLSRGKGVNIKNDKNPPFLPKYYGQDCRYSSKYNLRIKFGIAFCTTYETFIEI